MLSQLNSLSENYVKASDVSFRTFIQQIGIFMSVPLKISKNVLYLIG